MISYEERNYMQSVEELRDSSKAYYDAYVTLVVLKTSGGTTDEWAEAKEIWDEAEERYIDIIQEAFETVSGGFGQPQW